MKRLNKMMKSFYSEIVLQPELNRAEGRVNAQQHNALPAVELFGGQCRDGQQRHDDEHQRHVQNQGGIDAEDGLAHGHLERSQCDGNEKWNINKKDV